MAIAAQDPKVVPGIVQSVPSPAGDIGIGSCQFDFGEFWHLVPDEQRKRAINDLIQRIKESADKLASDGPSRGDLKILSRTLRELRYAFKVFSPYRRERKVTVFGSARTLPGISSGCVGA